MLTKCWWVNLTSAYIFGFPALRCKATNGFTLPWGLISGWSFQPHQSRWRNLTIELVGEVPQDTHGIFNPLRIHTDKSIHKPGVLCVLIAILVLLLSHLIFRLVVLKRGLDVVNQRVYQSISFSHVLTSLFVHRAQIPESEWEVESFNFIMTHHSGSNGNIPRMINNLEIKHLRRHMNRVEPKQLKAEGWSDAGASKKTTVKRDGCGKRWSSCQLIWHMSGQVSKISYQMRSWQKKMKTGERGRNTFLRRSMLQPQREEDKWVRFTWGIRWCCRRSLPQRVFAGLH